MNKLLIIGVCLFTAIGATAQLGTINSKKVFAAMPQLGKIDTLVTQYSEKYVQEFAKKRYATQLQLGIADSLYKTKPKDEATQKVITAAQNMQTDLQQYEQNANKEIAAYKDLLYKPYLEKVDDAVKAVALRRKYMQVVDINQVAFVYINNTNDITEDVIKLLKAKK